MNLSYEIKSRVPMPDMARFYGLQPDRAGFICCPFHGEKTPSMKLYEEARGFYCFGCHASGDVIDFVMRLFGLDFRGAVSKINTDFNLCLPIDRPVTLRERRAADGHYRARVAEKRRREALEADYDKKLSYWIHLDKNRRDYAPTSMTDEFNPLYVEAVKNIDRAAYALDQAEMRLYENDHK